MSWAEDEEDGLLLVAQLPEDPKEPLPPFLVTLHPIVAAVKSLPKMDFELYF
jgi:hypothetical protein